MKKKIAAGLMALTLVFGSAALLPASTEKNGSVISVSAETYNGWEYYTYEDHVIITGYSGTDKEVVVPSKIDGKTVTSISPDTDSWAMDCFHDNTFTKITIPATVTDIDSYAFWAAKSIQEIVVDKDNPKFASYDGMLFTKDMKTLLDCPEGKTGEVVIPDGVERVSHNSLGSFEDCNNITKITLPQSVVEIGRRTFRYCFDLKTFNIPKSIDQWYPELDLEGCDSLEKIIIEDGCKNYQDIDGSIYSVDDWGKKVLFFKNKNEKPLHITADCTEVYYDSYWKDGVNIGEYLPDVIDEREGYEIIGDGLYYNEGNQKSLVAYSTKVKNAEVAEGTTVITRSAFSGNGNIESVNIPDSVTEIQSYAFLNTGLNSVTLPDNVKVEIKAFGYNDDGTETKIDGFIIFANEGTDGERYAKENGFVCYPVGTVLDDSSAADDSVVDSQSDEPSQADSSKADEPSQTDSSASDSQTPADSSKTDPGDSSKANSNGSNSGKNPGTGLAVGFGALTLAGTAIMITMKRKK